MTEHELTAIIGLCLAILASMGSAILMVFKGGKWAGQVETLAKEVREGMAEWREDRKKLDVLPIHERDIEHLKSAATEQSRRMGDVWEKIFSHDKHIAVAQAVDKERQRSYNEIILDEEEVK